MLNNYRTSERERSKTLLVVEGSHEKKLLFFSLLKAFPEINIKRDNIWIYRTNIYMLYDQLIKEYSEPLEQVDIDLPYVLSRNADNKPTQYKRDYTNIFLVFDYERHDPNFSEYKINRLLSLFDNVTDVGQLYINYPMVESYMDFSCVPDAAFYQKKAWVIQRGNEYKNLVKDSPVLKLVELEHRIENILKEKYPGVSNSKIHNCVDLLLNESNSFSFDVIKEDIRSSVGDNDSLNQVSHLIADIIEKAFF
ncbi:MAG: hypothetical protein IJT32_01395, partial [Lachnospiraceae bacterium]|nr:hypothetical protein [Lachnospiraceae bacterium]